jgi:hypothetical protein
MMQRSWAKAACSAYQGVLFQCASRRVLANHRASRERLAESRATCRRSL